MAPSIVEYGAKDGVTSSVLVVRTGFALVHPPKIRVFTVHGIRRVSRTPDRLIYVVLRRSALVERTGIKGEWVEDNGRSDPIKLRIA